MSDIDINQGLFTLTGTKTSLRLLLQRAHRCLDGLGRAVEDEDFGMWLYGSHMLEHLHEHICTIIGPHVAGVVQEHGLSTDPTVIARLLAEVANASDTDRFWGPGYEAEHEDTKAVLTALLNRPLTNEEAAKMSPEDRAEYEEYLEGRSEAHRLERGQ